MDVAGLYDRHGRRVLAFCRSRLRSREEAEDAAQTTFLLAHRALRRGVVPLAEATWLVTIAQNVCLNRGRSARRVRAHELPREPQELERLAGAADPEPVDVDELRQAVEALPEAQRRALVLREWQGLSYAEIERELGLGKAAVETLIFRGRRAVAATLRGDGSARRRALDAGSLLSALKGLLGGGGAAAKLAGAAAVVVAGTGVALGTAGERPPAPASATLPRPAQVEVAAAAAHAAAADPSRAARPAAAPSSEPARRPPAPAPLAAAGSPARPAPATAARADAPAAAVPAPAAETPASAARPAPPAASTQPAVTTAPLPAALPFAPQPVEAAVETVAGAAEPVVGAVESVAATAAASVSGAVEQVAPALPPVAAPPPPPAFPAAPQLP